MQFFIRNILLASLLFIIIFSVFKCGSDTEEKKTSNEKIYKNLASDVNYVGSIKCRQCHSDIYETFIETGMGKSFDIATPKKSSGKFDKHSVVYDKSSDFYYYPFWSGDTMKILEFRLEGKDTVHKRIETVDYIIGSGHHTNSHIFNTNGYLHQMPMTFYTQDGKWDLAPGFENGNNTRFSRKIGLECMSCHNAPSDFLMGSENKFNNVPGGISCEGCHGPGEIHVKEKSAGIVVDTSKYIDYSIVNPAKLPIDLQFDACQRCHLQGNAVLKEGKSFFDFRPGMKLSDVMTIFLPKYENADEDFIMASHADRLKQSKCFLNTEARIQKAEENTLRPYKNGLTCVTCHNPHVSVKVTGKEIFNNACKSCHGGKTDVVCTEKQETRVRSQDNCVSCHMPKSGSIDIPHVTITDHFIRKPAKKVDVAGVKRFIGLIAINEKNPEPKVKAQAYINQYEKFERNPTFLDSSKKYLADKTADDVKNNFEALVHLYYMKNDFGKIISYASQFSRQTLLNDMLNHKSLMNDDAWTCYRIGEAYSNTGKTNDAYIFYQKASSLAPYNYELKNKYASSLFQLGKKEEAKRIFEQITNENPKFAPALSNLGFIYFQNGNKEKALQYYDKALALDPDYEQALLNKAGLLLYEKKNSEAIVLAKRILKRNPKNKQALGILLQYTK